MKIDVNDLLEKMAHGKRNLFVFGAAGTGKSRLIERLQETITDVLYAAPSGIAALNIRGITLHSLFCLKPVTPQPPFFDASINEDKAHLLQKAHTLLIDEISMVSCDLLDKVDIVLRKVRQNENPFGGIRMIFVGDIFQLHPFIASEYLPLMKKLYPDNGNHFNFFNSRVFSDDFLSDLVIYNLTYNYRQREDSDFGSILSSIRLGVYNEENMKLINEWVRERKNCVRLTTTNKIADYINKQKMEELPDMEYLSILKTTIFHQTETVRSPMKDELFIKEGMKMMFVMNDSQINGRRWVNGTIGRVVRKSFNEDKKLISVAVKVINRVSMDDKVYEVTRESYDIYEPFYNQDTDTIESRCIAKVEQFPFIPAWAITIHKSQSLTLDEIGIELGARAFAEGQVYVALSRVRARYGFFLNRPIVREDIKVSPETIRFYQESILPSKIDVFDPDAERADEALAQEIYEEIYLPGSIVNDFKF